MMFLHLLPWSPICQKVCRSEHTDPIVIAQAPEVIRYGLGKRARRLAPFLLAGGFAVFGEEGEDIRSSGSEHASMIASWNFDILIRHVQRLHLIDP